jgi:pyridoxamine 5'-phosphate oxidase
LATCGIDGQPSVRMVLLKSIDHKGLVFFTNYMSRKAQQLAENSKAGLVFYWPSLERQVRIEGNVERIDSEESRQYFDSRPRESQIGSAVSMQSQVVSSREEMELVAQRLRDSVGEKAVPYPTNWGGFCLLPVTFEFWQGRENRLHDRIRYQKDTSGNWNLDRLWP